MKSVYLPYCLILILSFVSCSQVKLAPLGPNEIKKDHEAFGKKFMISTQGKYSTDAGTKMFQLGGNAVDAATAITFVLGVERPQSTGIGGGGFLLYGSPKFPVPLTVDFREKAPLRAHSKMYLDSAGNEIKGKSFNGIFSVGVPGMVKGILEVHQQYGKLALETVLQPAIELAENGFKVYDELDTFLKWRESELKKYKATRKIFFKEGRLIKLGERLVQSDLAKTLTAISKKGADGFYKGWVGRAIVRENRRLGGLISQRDLNRYDVKYRQPIKGDYKGHTIFSMSPPSSGGIHIVQILNTVEKDNLKQYGILSPEAVHLTASAMQRAFADRAKYLGDTDFVKVPVAALTSKTYAQKIRTGISMSKAILGKDIIAGKNLPYESNETTHFTVADGEGNIITSTQTLNGPFGSGVVVPGTGIILNNEMDDFSTKPGALNIYGAVGSHKNRVQPEKRPLSSMSPTIVYKDGKPLLALGSPNGTRILTCVAQTLLNYLEFELPLYESVAAVRFHQQWNPDEIRVEEVGLPDKTMKALKEKGHKLRLKNWHCKVQAVAFEGGELHGVSDPRGQGKSFGL